MPATIDFLGADPLATADELESLAADLRLLAGGIVPDAASLSTSPLMWRWGMTRRAVPCLDGLYYGHPSLPDGTRGQSSQVYAINRESNWVRTATRYHSLGPARMFGVDT